MGHYKSNVRDLEFNLFEVLKINEALDAGEFGDMDTETAKGILMAAMVEFYAILSLLASILMIMNLSL